MLGTRAGRTCAYCGTSNAPGAMSCINCGTLLTQQQPPDGGQYPQTAQQQYYPMPLPSKPKKKSGSLIVGVVIVVVILILAAISFTVLRGGNLGGGLLGGKPETLIFFADGKTVDFSTDCSGCWVHNSYSTTFIWYTDIMGSENGDSSHSIDLLFPSNSPGSSQSPSGGGSVTYTIPNTGGGGSGWTAGDDVNWGPNQATITVYSNYSITITNYGAVGDYIEGTFWAKVIGSNGNTIDITNGYFKVIRTTDSGT